MSYLITNKALTDPFSLLDTDVINQLSNWSPFFANQKTGDTVRFNESAEGHVVEIDLPGVKKENCKIETTVVGLNNVRVFVTASRSIVHKGGQRDETYTREVTLKNVQEKNVHAKLEDGVLTITAPIESAKEKRRVIDIQ
jgi:HSP20 family molecular chaperone IbpA